jgi:hypothetical protein
MMNSIFETFSDHTAPPGHVTFSVLGPAEGGHSVTISEGSYPGVVRAAKNVLSDLRRAIVFDGALTILRRQAECAGNCQHDGDELLSAFIAAVLKHPDKRVSKALTVGIRKQLRQEGGAHIILTMAKGAPGLWKIGSPSGTGQVQ